MDECSGVVVELVGGPQDGECVLMNPCPGVGPPNLLCYFANRQDGETETYVMDTYQLVPLIPTWPPAGSGDSFPCGDKVLLDVMRVQARWQGVMTLKARNG